MLTATTCVLAVLPWEAKIDHLCAQAVQQPLLAADLSAQQPQLTLQPLPLTARPLLTRLQLT